MNINKELLPVLCDLLTHISKPNELQEDMQKMFQNPGDNLLLFKTYSVDYVMVSAYETGNFSADEAALSKYFTCVYDENGIRLYKVPAL